MVEKASSDHLAFLESIFRAAPLGIGVVVKRVFTQVNDHLCEMLGYSREELLGQSARLIYPSQEEFERVGKVKYAQIDVAGVGSIETKWQRKDGTVIDVLLSSSPIDPADRDKGVTFTALNITARKQMEEHLRRAEASFRTLVEQVPAVIYVDNTDEVSSAVYISPQVETMLGYAPEEWLKEPDLWVKLIHPQDLQEVLAHNHLTNVTGEPFNMDYRMIARDGRVVWVRDQAVLEYDQDSKPLYWRGIMMDITDQKTAQERLMKSEEKFSKAFHTSPDSININRLEDGLYLEINDGFTQITGYTREDVIGKSSLEINIWANPQDRQRLVEGLRKDGVVNSMEAEFRAKDGSIRIGLMSARVLDINGEPCILSITRDITQRKQREEELEAIVAVSAAMRQAGSQAEMLPILAEQYRHLFHADSVMICLTDNETAEGSVAFADGSWSKLNQRRISADSKLLREMSEGGECFNAEALSCFEEAFDTPAGCSSMILMPMKTSHAHVGLVIIGRKAAFDSHDLRILRAVSDIAASALQRVAYHEQTERRLQRLNALHLVNRSINASMDMDFTLGMVLSQVVEQLDVEGAAIYFFREASRSLTLAACRGYRGEPFASVYDLRDDPAFQAILDRRMTLIPDLSAVRADQRFLARTLGQGFSAYAAVPLITKGKVKGVLEIYKRSPFSMDSDWRQYLESLAEQTAIAMGNAEMFSELQKSHADLRFAYEATIEGWSRALDLRDRETEGHTRRVTEMTVRLAQAMGISDDRLIPIRRGALLHDIGKMAIPDAILNKPAALTEEEWVLMRQHPQFAVDLLSPIEYLKPALDIPYCHHEKWDGSGYPRGLKGMQIPLAARIFAVVDVWDALRSDRPYRAAWPDDQVYEYIRSEAGKHFDPQVVQAFFEYIARNNPSAPVSGEAG